MNTWEAIKYLQKGNKIRRKVWDKGDYIMLGRTGTIVNKNYNTCPIQLSKLYSDWEVVK
ncbi:Thoeris anti-defense Tad2 family protein [Metaclostridioides mangenotii]|uniref:Thoeris anti-defense Tad2 family protein n=1 Tax=Metaclostridioides mangenotii TaxID=1540 RepID=UPI0004B03F48|nr:hypothetical protein [Clostridioides mangenotii]